MGISELLKILKPIIQEKNLSSFKGKTAAIDVSTWLYRGVYASAVDIGLGKKSDLYLNFPLKMISSLISYGIHCIAVFDGHNLKAKKQVEESRSENKKKNLELAKKMMSEGKEEESKKIFRRALKIKSRMVNSLIEILKSLGVTTVISPYEADSQISFLCNNGLADFAISEDSDLIPFGVKKIAFKLNTNGDCCFLDMDEFISTPIVELTDHITRTLHKIFSNRVKIAEFCVMLGCDYLPSIKGFGIKTAISMFEKYDKIETIIHQMKFVEKFKKNLPDNYLNDVKRTATLFLLQTVYNSKENKLQPLTNIETITESEKISLNSNMAFFNSIEDSENFFGVKFDKFVDYCTGKLDVNTLSIDKKIEDRVVLQKYINKFRNNYHNEENVDQSINIIEVTNYYQDEQEIKENEIINNIDTCYKNDFYETNNFLGKNYIENNREQQELEIAIKISEVEYFSKKEKKNQIYNINNDEEIKNILQICQNLTKDEKSLEVEKELRKIDSRTSSPEKIKREKILGNTTKIHQFISNYGKVIDEKPIKDLFDIMDNEKLTENILTNLNKNDENLRHPINKSIISPKFSKVLSPCKTSEYNHTTSPIGKSPSKFINEMSSNSVKNKSIISSIFSKSPNSLTNNTNHHPFIFIKRKNNELTPKFLNFNEESVSKSKTNLNTEEKLRDGNIMNFITKKFKTNNQ